VIDFRYHLVSVIGIFLALAVGIVLGTAAANGVVLDNLNGQVNRLRTDKGDLRKTLDDLQTESNAGKAFVKLWLPTLVAHRLADQRVAVLSAPGTPSGLRTDVVAALRQAGATVTSQVQISADYVDPARDATLASVVSSLGSAEGDAPTRSGAELAAASLATALVAKRSGRAPAAEESTRVLTAFQRAGMIDLTGNGNPNAASLAVLLAAPAEKGKNDATKASDTVLLALAVALDVGSDGAVISGPLTATANDGLLAAARSSNDVRHAVGTVDSADSPVGQVETVLALAAQLRGEAVAWGTGPGTSAPVISLSSS